MDARWYEASSSFLFGVLPLSIQAVLKVGFIKIHELCYGDIFLGIMSMLLVSYNTQDMPKEVFSLPGWSTAGSNGALKSVSK